MPTKATSSARCVRCRSAENVTGKYFLLCEECKRKAPPPFFIGNCSEGEYTPSGRKVLGNFKRMRDAHILASAKGAMVVPYLTGKFARGWVVQTIEIVDPLHPENLPF